jgi:hypothetical protein
MIMEPQGTYGPRCVDFRLYFHAVVMHGDDDRDPEMLLTRVALSRLSSKS